MQKLLMIALLMTSNCYGQTYAPLSFEAEQSMRMTQCSQAESAIESFYQLTDIDDVLTICGMVDTHDDECTMLVEQCGY